LPIGEKTLVSQSRKDAKKRIVFFFCGLAWGVAEGVSGEKKLTWCSLRFALRLCVSAVQD
jgi:hypothetical protein